MNGKELVKIENISLSVACCCAIGNSKFRNSHTLEFIQVPLITLAVSSRHGIIIISVLIRFAMGLSDTSKLLGDHLYFTHNWKCSVES